MRLKSTIIIIMILSLVLVSCTNSNAGTKLEGEITTMEGEITFYVANDDLTSWAKYNKEIDGDLINIIEQLKLDEKSFIPKDTKVLDIDIKDGIAYINLSSEFDTPESNASTPASYKIKSIVKTLCLNKKLEINGVRFLINGEYVDSIGPILTEGIIKD